jgi:hypothetical protein
MRRADLKEYCTMEMLQKVKIQSTGILFYTTNEVKGDRR